MNPLLGFGAGRSKGPWAVNYCGVSQFAVASFTVQYDLGVAFGDRSVWILQNSNTAAFTSLTVGGVAASLYASGTYVHAWRAKNVPGRLVNIVATRASGAHAFGVYTVTGALGGADTAPVVRSGYSNNDNSVSVSYSSRVAGDIFLAIGGKGGGAAGSFGGWSCSPSEARIIEDAAPWVNNLGDTGFGRSVQQTGTSAATLTTLGSDVSKSTTQLVLKFSKAP